MEEYRLITLFAGTVSASSFTIGGFHVPQPDHQTGALQAVVGEPEVVEDGRARGVEDTAAWLALKDAAIALQGIQAQDGSIPDAADHGDARVHVDDDRRVDPGTRALVPARRGVPRRERAATSNAGLTAASACPTSSTRSWRSSRSCTGRTASVISSCSRCTRRTGRASRHVEALLVEVIWPEFIAQLETEYVNRLFVSLRLIDFTPGYDTNSAVLFPETVAMREIPTFTWGAIFQDREAARYRRVVRAAAEITKLELPDEAARMLERPGAHREDVRDVGHHPRPHPHARRPAVRPLHDQAADAVLPVLARGAALRPDGVPRVRGDHEATARARRACRRDAQRRRGRDARARGARSVRRDLRPDLPVLDHRHSRAQLRRGSAASCCSRGCTSAACCTGPTRRSRSTGTACRRRSSRWAMRSTSSTGARSTDRRWRTGSPRTSWCGAR